MKNRRLILHIGMPKTGTTSIQKSLFASRKKLESYGCYYPESVPDNHGNLFFSMFNEEYIASPANLKQGIRDEEDFRNYKKQLFELWNDEFKKCKDQTFIVSGENIPNLEENGVKMLHNYLRQYYENITVVCYVREPISWAKSWIQQMVRLGTWTIEGKALNPPRPNYRKRIEKFIKIFGRDNVIVKLFDEETLFNKDVIDDFIITCGLDERLIHCIEKIQDNSSLGEYSIKFLSEYNKKYPLIINGELNPRRGQISENLLTEIFRQIPDKRLLLPISYPPDAAKIINEDIDYINEFLYDDKKIEPIPTDIDEIDQYKVNIPNDFFVELVNEYNKKLEDQETFSNKNEDAKNQELFYLYTKKYKSLFNRLRNIIYYYLYYKKLLRLLDKEYYLNNYDDVARSGMNPLRHFIYYGAPEGRNPSEEINTVEYVSKNIHLVLSGYNPLFHLIKNNRS